ncbi:MAG: pilus assembly PilX N-terminal domain-containing protein [Gammaproteobacteria bacterium]|nr:pilus assembly PilX N-terminal domain-containing protein [Gammaproteobacteria bacterium]MBU1970060.1 pilus assembly PilX N-terminal domain-containing protein [Gammaproteobacteria bacterium]
MKTLTTCRTKTPCKSKQRGVVLFFALIALVAMSLAAVALIRSVDTSTLIAGNLAFRQSATTVADAGIEAAMGWLDDTELDNGVLNVVTDPIHPFNVTDLDTNPGYHSSFDPNLNLFADTTWDDDNNNNRLVGTDPTTGNEVRYVIQRMCRIADQPIKDAECLFSDAKQDLNGQNIPLPQEICVGPRCPAAGQSPQIRITARTKGSRNTVSYVQAFVY